MIQMKLVNQLLIQTRCHCLRKVNLWLKKLKLFYDIQKNKSPVKRKGMSSKDRTKNFRSNFNEEQKKIAKEDDKIRKVNVRYNISEKQKKIAKEANTNRMENAPSNISEKQKKIAKEDDKKRKELNRRKTIEEVLQMYNDVQSYDMTDPNILDTDAYSCMLNKFEKSMQEDHTYVCNVCWKFEYRTNVLIMNTEKYEHQIFSMCKTDLNHNKDQVYICKSCDRSLKKGKMPAQAQNNGLKLNVIPKEI